MSEVNPEEGDAEPIGAPEDKVVQVSDLKALGLLQAKWLEKQAEIAVEMGIEGLEDFTDLLENMSTEEFRTVGIQKLKAVDEVMASNLQISRIVATLANRMIDAPTRLAATHISVQEAVLDRIIDLAPKAGADELYSLVATYSALPAPFTQTFYVPLDEKEVDEIATEAEEKPDEEDGR